MSEKTMLTLSAEATLKFDEAKEILSSEDYTRFLFIVSCKLEEARSELYRSEKKELDRMMRRVK